MTIARDLTDATMQIQLRTTADHLYAFLLSTRGICFINSSCTLLLTHNKIVSRSTKILVQPVHNL